MKFAHVNIIATNLEKLVDFYVNVFDCKQLAPESKLSGEWVEKGTRVAQAEARNINLKLPGYGDNGPEIELFQYKNTIENSETPMANKQGLRHLAFQVENVSEILEKVIKYGGNEFGEVVKKEFKSGTLTYTYVTDPEGNIIEVQNWTPKLSV